MQRLDHSLSRLKGEINLALYDRAIRQLRATSHGPLLEELGFAQVLRDMKAGVH